MKEFAQKFADLTIKMREAELAKMTATALRSKFVKERDALIKNTEEFVPGVYDVKNGHVMVADDGNLSFWEDNDNG